MEPQYREEEEFETALSGKLLWRLARLNLTHRSLLVIYLVSIIAVAVVDSYFTFLSKRIVDEALLVGDTGMLRRLMLHYGLLVLALAAAVFGFIFSAGYLGERIRYDLCRSMFARLQTLSLAYFDRTPVGWLMARLTSDSRRVGEMVSWGVLDMLWGSCNIVIALGFMAFISWKLALVMMVIIPVTLYVAFKFQRRILEEQRRVRSANSRITAEFNESITGIRVVKSLARERANFLKFQTLSGEMFTAGYRAAWLSALFLPIVQLTAALAVGTIIWYGGWQFEMGELTVGGIQAFIGFIGLMVFPIEEMSRVLAQMQQAFASGERVFSLMDTVPEIQDAPHALSPDSMRGDIEFDNVTFAYEEGRPVLEGIDLHVRQGETIALVGPTGAGKSTLVNLVCRFLEPQSGTIRINGFDLKLLTQESIQSRIGMVLQVPHLFAGTVFQNIQYGLLEATEEGVRDAARQAGADEFIRKLPQGYKSQVGEEGLMLSVGQKQLISIARAILSDPDIFVMDEATSSVDTVTEAMVQKGMEEILRNRTSFVIAHRLSTIRRADRILVIREGGIGEMGTHHELIRARGYYHELYTRQFREERARVMDPFHDTRVAPAPSQSQVV